MLIGWMNNWSYAGDVPCSGVDHKQAWLAVYEYGGGDMSGRGDEKV
jgi:hypothetical protein